MLCIAAFIAAGCDSGIGDKTVNQIKDESSKTVEELKRILTDLAPSQDQIHSLTTEEVKKLSVFEYRVYELAKDPATIDLEAALESAGRERWECFGILPGEKSLRLLCKRRPETYLRYIPRVFP